MPALRQRKAPKANIIAPSGRLAARVRRTSSFVKVSSFQQDQTDQHVFDMAGNVSELCRDVYEPYSSLDPSATSKAKPLDDPGQPEAAGRPEARPLCGAGRLDLLIRTEGPHILSSRV